MSTTLQLLLFLLPLGAGLIIGAGNYLLVRGAYDHVPDFVEGVSFPCALLLFLIVLPSILMVPPLLVLLPLGILAARADKAISTENDTILWHFWRLCVAVVVSLVDALLIFLVVALLAEKTPLLPRIELGMFSMIPAGVGFMAGPIVAPLWIWSYRKVNAFLKRPLAHSNRFE